MSESSVTTTTHTAAIDQLVSLAAYLHERLDTSRFLSDEAHEGTRRLEDAIEGQADVELIAAWAAHSGAELADLNAALKGVIVHPDAACPAWARFFEDVSRRAQHPSDPLVGPPIAFDEVLLPFVDTALERINPEIHQLQKTAVEQVRRAWCEACAEVAARTLHIACTVDRMTSLLTLSVDSQCDSHYTAFVKQMRSDALWPMAKQWPVLVRRLCTMVCNRADAMLEFLMRRTADAADIGAFFGTSVGSSPITSIRPGLSDPHCGGRSVIQFETVPGDRMIYKPRSLAIECAYQDIVELLRARHPEFALDTIATLDRQTHGWVEEVSRQGCTNPEAVHRFYQLAGMQLALVHALDGEDYHFDNLIARDDQPLLIDHECLCKGRGRRETDDTSAARAAYDELYDSSVLATSLVPRWVGTPSGRRTDISGLGNHAQQSTDSKTHRWTHVNTDQMALVATPSTFCARGNLVTLNAQRVAPEDHEDDVVDGFTRMYDWLLHDRSELLAEHAQTMEAPARAPVRDVRRRTEEYVTLLKGLQSPRFQSDGVDQSLLVAHLFDPDAPEASMREQAQLLDGDIPWFERTPVGSDDYSVRALLERLSPMGRDRQVAILRTAFRLINATSHRVTIGEGVAAPSGTSDEPPIDRAVAIAQAIEHLAVLETQPGQTPAAAWIAPVLHAQSDTWGLDTLPCGLMHGQGGIALFLASLGEATGEARWGHLARGALCRVLNDIDTGRNPSHQSQWIGALEGAPSAAAALLLVGERTADESLSSAGWTLLERTTPADIRGAAANDLVLGLAGFVQVASLFASRRYPTWLKEAAHQAVEELLARVQETSIGGVAWTAPDGTWMTGLSHGTAGIIQALLAARHRLGGDVPQEVVDEARAFEHAMRDPTQGVWRHSLDPGTGAIEPAWSTWCHGPPGMSLSFLAQHELEGCPKSLELALEAATRTLETPRCDTSSLCCGETGRAMTLATTAAALGRDDWRDAAIERMQQVEDTPQMPVHNPTLFKGLAGLGMGHLLAHSGMARNPMPWFTVAHH